MYRTEQENFWAGEFGNEYVGRNRGEQMIASNVSLFSKILARTGGGKVKNVLEFGANIGLNLRALKVLLPNVDCHAIEINESAAHELKEFLPEENVYVGSILEFDEQQHKEQYDLTFTSGVLIHINPSELQNIYQKLYSCSRKYICVMIAIGNSLILSPSFPPLHTVRASFDSYGVPSLQYFSSSIQTNIGDFYWLGVCAIKLLYCRLFRGVYSTFGFGRH